jgi:hypothetical protein
MGFFIDHSANSGPKASHSICWHPRNLLVLLLVSCGLYSRGNPSTGYLQMALTDVFVKNVRPGKRPAKHSDNGGLHLLVSTTGSKLWRWSYRFGDKQKTLAFGAYPTVMLADARGQRDEAKKQLAKGIDPAEQRKTATKTQSWPLNQSSLARTASAKPPRLTFWQRAPW